MRHKHEHTINIDDVYRCVAIKSDRGNYDLFLRKDRKDIRIGKIIIKNRATVVRMDQELPNIPEEMIVKCMELADNILYEGE